MHRTLTVVKIGGALLDSADTFHGTFTALLALHEEIRAAGGLGVVLVHGGGAAVDRQFARLGLQSEKRQGIRITPAEHIDDLVPTEAIEAGIKAAIDEIDDATFAFAVDVIRDRGAYEVESQAKAIALRMLRETAAPAESAAAMTTE